MCLPKRRIVLTYVLWGVYELLAAISRDIALKDAQEAASGAPEAASGAPEAASDSLTVYSAINSAIYGMTCGLQLSVFVHGLMYSLCFFAFDVVRHVAMHLLYAPREYSDVGSLIDRIKACFLPSAEEPSVKEFIWILLIAFIAQTKYAMPRLACIVFWYLGKYLDTQIRVVLSMMSRAEYDNTVTVEPVKSSVPKVTCPICMEYETNTALSCGHTFCYTCVDQLVENHGESDAPCPICRLDIIGMSTIYHPGE